MFSLCTLHDAWRKVPLYTTATSAPPPNPTYKLYCPLDGAVPPSTVLPHTTPAILTNVEPPVLLASDAARLLPPAMVVRKETWCVSKLVDQMVVQVVVTIRRWFLRWSRRW